MLKVVITGASGFLGSNLTKKLEDNLNFEVYALSSKNVESVCSNIKYVHKDIIKSCEAEDILSDAIVVNCAFPRNSMGIEIADGLAYINRLFMSCKKYKAKAIINISSQSVYSQKREFPADENTEVCLESPYAVGKYATELMLKGICEGTEVVFTNIRMASLIGPGFDQRIVNRLVKKAINKENLIIDRSKRKFGFLDIDDAVFGLLCVIYKDVEEWNDIYTLGNSKGYTIEEIVIIIKSLFDRRNIPFPDIEFRDDLSNIDTSVSFKKLNVDTGFFPKKKIERSIEDIINSYIN